MPFVKKVVKALKKTLKEEILARETVAGLAKPSEDESKECSMPTKTGINNVISHTWRLNDDGMDDSDYLIDQMKDALNSYFSAFSYGLDTSSSQFKNIDDMKKEVYVQIHQFIKTMYDKKGGVSLNKLLSTVNGYLDDNWTMSTSSITPISSHSTTKTKKRDDASQKIKKMDQLLQLAFNTGGNVASLYYLIKILNDDDETFKSNRLNVLGTSLGFAGWALILADLIV